MFEQVLVGVDDRHGGQDAIALAKQLAAPKAEVTLANVYPLGFGRGATAGIVFDSDIEAVRELLEERREEAALDAQTVATVAHAVGAGLREIAERRGADLIVIGSTHRGPLRRIIMGDDAAATLHGSPCPVALAPGGYAASGRKIGRIGIGFDGSPESAQALSAALELAGRHDATITAMAVVWKPPRPFVGPVIDERPEVAAQRVHDQLQTLIGAEKVQQRLVIGNSEEELADFTEDLDLLVVGSRGQGLLARLRNGSTSDYLARHTHCPLLVMVHDAAGAAEADSYSGAPEVPARTTNPGG